MSSKNPYLQALQESEQSFTEREENEEYDNEESEIEDLFQMHKVSEVDDEQEIVDELPESLTPSNFYDQSNADYTSPVIRAIAEIEERRKTNVTKALSSVSDMNRIKESV